jgi:hypothetical protein
VIKVVTEPFEKIDLTYLKSVGLTKDKLAGSGVDRQEVHDRRMEFVND